MAEEPIKHDDIIEDKVFQPTVESADLLLEKLSLLIGGFRELAKITGAKINSALDPKTISDVDKLSAATAKLSSIEKGLTDVERVQAQVMLKTRKARQDLNDQLKSQGGLLGDLIIKKKQLGLDLLSAKTADQVKKINQELFKTNGQIREIKEGGVKSFNTWGNALQSFQFKFNALGSTIGNVLGNFASGALSGGIGMLTNGISFLASSFTALIFPVKRSSEEIQEQTDRIKKLSQAIEELTTFQKIQLELLGKDITDLDDLKEAEKALNDEVQASVDKINERLEAEKELRDSKKGGLNDLKRELEILKVNGSTKIEISKKEKQIRDIELSDLLERQKVLGDFAMLDIALQQEILDKKNEILVEDAKIQKEIRDKEAEDAKKEDKKTLERFTEAQKNKVALEKKISKEIFDHSVEMQKQADDARDLEMKQEEEDRKIQLENNKKAHDEALKLIKERMEAIQELNDAWFDGLQDGNERRKKINADNISDLERQIDFQRELAVNGEKNTLNELEKARAEALEQRAKLDKKEAQQKQAEKLAEIFLEFYKVFSSEKPASAAFGKAIAATAKGKAGQAIVRAFAGAFKEGTEDTGGAGNVDSDGGKWAILHPNERVLTKEQNKKLGGISNDDLADSVWAMNNVYPKLSAISDEQKSVQVMKVMQSMIQSELKKQTKAIEDLAGFDFKRNVLDEIITIEKRQGVINQTTHKQAHPSYSKH